MDKRALMRDREESSRCPLCGGQKIPGSTTYTVDLGFGIVVVRNVPATVCSQCAEAWIAPHVAEKLEGIVEDARERHDQVHVVAM